MPFFISTAMRFKSLKVLQKFHIKVGRKRPCDLFETDESCLSNNIMMKLFESRTAPIV